MTDDPKHPHTPFPNRRPRPVVTFEPGEFDGRWWSSRAKALMLEFRRMRVGDLMPPGWESKWAEVVSEMPSLAAAGVFTIPPDVMRAFEAGAVAAIPSRLQWEWDADGREVPA